MTNAQHPAAIDVAGQPYLRDAKGSLVPLATIKPVDLLMDETVRGITDRARELSALVRGFKGETFDAVGSLQALIAQQYGASIGGAKGNVTLSSFDGCLKVQVLLAPLVATAEAAQAGAEAARDAAQAVVPSLLASTSLTRDPLAALRAKIFAGLTELIRAQMAFAGQVGILVALAFGIYAHGRVHRELSLGRALAAYGLMLIVAIVTSAVIGAPAVMR